LYASAQIAIAAADIVAQMKAAPQSRSSCRPQDFNLAVHVTDIYQRSKVLLARAHFDGTLQLLTAAWEKALGYAPQEFEGKTLCQLMGLGENAAADVVVAILDEQTMDPVDLTVRTRAGEAKYLRFHRRLDGYERTIFIVAEQDPASSARWQTDGMSVWSHPRTNHHGSMKMNWDRIEGNWKQLKGNVLQQWGRLTEDQLDVIAGKRDVLLGRIQELYGISKDEGERQLADWETRMQAIGLSNETTVVPAPK
jgi:uncharacterized protein YjbJ (UPF0337 family)